MASGSPSSSMPTSNDSFWESTWLRRTLFTMDELMQFAVGRRRRDPQRFLYDSNMCDAWRESVTATCSRDRRSDCAHHDGELTDTTAAADRERRTSRAPLPPDGFFPHPSLVAVDDNESPGGSGCPQGLGCRHAHTPYEFWFHVANYKRFPCRTASHMALYPAHLRWHRNHDVSTSSVTADGDADMTPEDRDTLTATLQRCPFYHSGAEAEVWGEWRRVAAAIGSTDEAQREAGRCALRDGEWMREFREGLLRWVETTVRTEVQRAMSGEMATSLVLGSLDAVTITATMLRGASQHSAHRTVCFMPLIEVAYEGELNCWFPENDVSAELRLDLHEVLSWARLEVASATGGESHPRLPPMGALDMLTFDVDALLSQDHRRQLATFLLTSFAGGENSKASGITTRVFPHRCSDPAGYEEPHLYVEYVLHVASRLGSHPSVPEFMQRSAAAFNASITHWMITNGWIRKRDVVSSVVMRFVDVAA